MKERLTPRPDGEYDTTWGREGLYCPHCGALQRDAWDIETDPSGNGGTDCDFCEKPFEFDLEYTPSYRSWKPEGSEL